MVKIRKQSAKRVTRKGASNVIDRIAPIGFDDNDGIKINVYGRSGTGKTTFWATFPKPILALICSGGKKPGELRSIDTVAYRKTIKHVVLKNTAEFRELVEYQAETKTYQTLVLDHVTSFQDLVLKEILGLEKIPEQGSWGMARQQDWGTCGLRVKENLAALLSLDCNVVIVGQERVFDSDVENAEMIRPSVNSAVTPTVKNWLEAACDNIGQMFIRAKTEKKALLKGQPKVSVRLGGVEYCLRTEPHETFSTKLRVPKGGNIPDAIVDPTFEKIQALITRLRKGEK